MARILIVDDSPTQLLSLKRVVEKLGHSVITAEDGAAGVEVAKREVPELILMDVVMPNLNGFQATRSIAKDPKTSHIPVILVTGYAEELDRARQVDARVLSKPFDIALLDSLLKAIREGGAAAERATRSADHPQAQHRAAR